MLGHHHGREAAVKRRMAVVFMGSLLALGGCTDFGRDDDDDDDNGNRGGDGEGDENRGRDNNRGGDGENDDGDEGDGGG